MSADDTLTVYLSGVASGMASALISVGASMADAARLATAHAARILDDPIVRNEILDHIAAGTVGITKLTFSDVTP